MHVWDRMLFLLMNFNEEMHFSAIHFLAHYFFYIRRVVSITSKTECEMGKIILSILQLQIGALSEELSRKINDSIFKKKDDSIDLFDDLGENNSIELFRYWSGWSGIFA